MTDARTILVVDDIPENIDVLNGILRPYYRVKVALNGERALTIIDKSPPDLILLDIMMPVMDGYEVCRILKSREGVRDIPVIFVTARNEIEDETLGFEVGAADYITKPISPPLVLSRVRTHLALRTQHQSLERQVQQRTEELERTRLEIIRRLGRASEYRDNETGMHVIRMSHYAQILARSFGLSDADCRLILHAAPMHDVGKIGIPDRILLKPGRLDESELAIMRRHPAFGAAIIGNHPDSRLLETAHTVALSHHERWDGGGYPAGLRAESIPLVGRIVAIADVFDALTSQRPYKAAWEVSRAVDLLQSESGAQFDPSLVPAFLRVLPQVLEIKERYADDAADPDSLLLTGPHPGERGGG
ncbi:MAG: response regulator [Magnetococcus sp. WYHC-3]